MRVSLKARYRLAPFAAAIQLLFVTGRVAYAQGEISGRVLAADSSRLPVAGAEASIPRLQRTVQSDSLGRFRLKDLPADYAQEFFVDNAKLLFPDL